MTELSSITERIVAVEDVNTQDYPAHVASIIYTRGCNLKCPYCQNPEIVLASASGCLGIYPVVKKLKKNKLIDSVVLTGGEPTVNEDFLYDLIREIKSTTKLKIKLDTNGTHPEALRFLRGSVDYIAMDIKTSIDKYNLLGWGWKNTPFLCIELVDSIDIIKRFYPDREFRTTCVSPFAEEIITWAGHLRGEKLYLQEANMKRILNPEYKMRAMTMDEIISLRDAMIYLGVHAEIRGS